MSHQVDQAPHGARLARAEAGWRPSWWPPLLAWLSATAVVLTTCAVAGWPPFAPITTWARQDSFLYLSIARHGYTLGICSELNQHIDGAWCGNSGWFPAYPWIVGGLHQLGLPLAGTALAISWLAGLGTLIVLWRAFLAGRGALGAGVALCYAAFAPGLVYTYADFPLSLVTFSAVVSLALLQRRRWLASGIAAAVAALAYPIGLAVAPAGAVWVLTERGAARRERLRRLALVAGPSLLGLAGFALAQRLETGRWNAYLLAQQKYGHQVRDPLTANGTAVRMFVHSPFLARPSLADLDQLASASSLQTLLVAFVVVCVVVELAVRRGATVRDDTLIAVWAVLAWLLLYAGSQVHTYRGETALLPIAVLVRRLPAPLAIAITAVAVLLVVPMTQLYLADALR